MAKWGVDLGVRSIYAARLGSTFDLFSVQLPIHKHTRSEELTLLHAWILSTIDPDDVVFVEEPPLAGSRNPRTFLHLAQTSGVVASACKAQLVPVSSWKKGTVGNGSASKDLVSAWLRRVHPDLSEACSGDQNYVDATCIALFALGQG
jgi:Holliday junction resolvasome RuvABC endonuclease subunit